MIAMLLLMSCLWDAGDPKPGAMEVVPVVLDFFEYPILGAQARIEGVVKVEVQLDDQGAPSQVTVISGHKLLAAAVVSGIQSWRFAPRCEDQNLVSRRPVPLQFTFKLEGLAQGRPRTRIRYVFPREVVITSEMPHYQPIASRRRE